MVTYRRRQCGSQNRGFFFCSKLCTVQRSMRHSWKYQVEIGLMLHNKQGIQYVQKRETWTDSEKETHTHDSVKRPLFLVVVAAVNYGSMGTLYCTDAYENYFYTCGIFF